jgi:virginiamycin B lyase
VKRAVFFVLSIGGSALLTGQPAIQEFGTFASRGLDYIAAGPDGALWFSAPLDGKIGRISIAGVVTEFPLTQESSPLGITLGPDGALWFTVNGLGGGAGNRIGRITTAGAISEFPIPTGSLLPQPGGITAGPDGALWFTEQVGNKIGRITTGGSLTEFAVPTGNSFPNGIAAGPDGALWFTEGNAGKIGRIATDGTFNEFQIPAGGSEPFGITLGPDGALWFADAGLSRIGRITTVGTVAEFPIPAVVGIIQPFGITAGPDGAIWFAGGNNTIGRITTAGVITEFAPPTAFSRPFGIALGPDGALWFTEENVNKIGRVVLPPAAPNSGQYTISTLAGTGSSIPSGDNGPAKAAAVNPFGVAADRFGNLFFADLGSVTGKVQAAVREVNSSGTMLNIGCNGSEFPGVPPNPSTIPVTQANCGNIAGVAVDNAGDIYVTQGGGRTLDLIDPSGNLTVLTFLLNSPQNAAVDGAGNVYIADDGDCVIVRTNKSGALTTVAGTSQSCGFSSTQLNFPNGVAADRAGNVYIADTDNLRVRKAGPSGITPVAGTGVEGLASDGQVAVDAMIGAPTGVAVDEDGNVFIADYTNGRIWRVDPSGIITHIAGGGTEVGDGKPATSEQLVFPFDVALGLGGKLYVADTGDFLIRLLTPVPSVPLTTVKVTSSGLLFSRLTQTFNGTVTITNKGQQAIAGPLQLVMTKLPAGVVLANATGNTNGNPFIAVPGVTSLGPGHSASVNVQFQDPSNTTITFTPIVFSGSY